MLALFSAGIAPAFALMAFFYLKDRFTEPLSLMVKTFLFGALLVFPIMFIQYGFTAENLSTSSFVQSFLLSGLLEEFFKWFIFMYVIFHHTDFDAHYDGIVYAVSISLGFASVENILYLMTNGIEYAFTRALFPVSSHALFGVMMGYHFGKAKMNQTHQKWNILLALSVPFLLHGTYNYILKTVTSDWLVLLIPFMTGLWFVALHRMKTANQNVIYSRHEQQKKQA
ncbi:Membrane proteinase PrsW, cleaves anti-sigma factor RsiW, M82 family [Lentibacillus halodurans]|uniref:Protease PrsW n=1 Tax=Lentibacillus halodurans TaxID=237679 RepID=A0A1I0VAL0_9BACI|nr:glutamic-type intramembrane protease PrsW [Lentibacillus halodurans]SFA73424.1 Membrane proteinase PrsW, cleaves anti-sigma factor RsiW, M82 family [Lentibacillus halodurans]